MKRFGFSVLLAGAFALPNLALAAFNYWDVTDPTKAPQNLSQTGIYSNITTKTMDTSAKYFTVNSALWSDGSAKKRWIIMKPGKKITYNDTVEFFNYPDSTVFVKTFFLVRPPSDSVYWETRLLIYKRDTADGNDWYGFSYRWNAAATNATLVSLDMGFDTVFQYTENGRQTYRKWHFPSQVECARCHITQQVTDENERKIHGRSVLGFFPAQLKGPSPLTPGVNQVIDLWNKGVFTGTQPNAAALARRWRGINEGVPAGLTGDARFRVIDTMARAYIAANCSGCHSQRGKLTAGIHQDLDYDFHNLSVGRKPNMEYGHRLTAPFGLNDTTTYDSLSRKEGRAAMLENVAMGGLGTDPNWDMAMPPWPNGDPAELVPALVYPGYPSMSTILYRQLQRSPPWMDSARVKRNLLQCAEWDPECADKLTWVFSQPWGSTAWFNLLRTKGATLDDIDMDFFGASQGQMPPLATYLPDIAAMRILGEWAKTYRSDSVLNIRGSRLAKLPRGGALIRNRTLLVPKEWTGTAQMLDIQGRTYKLRQIGPGMYAMPAQAKAGVFYFRVGSHSFKAAMF